MLPTLLALTLAAATATPTPTPTPTAIPTLAPSAPLTPGLVGAAAVLAALAAAALMLTRRRTRRERVLEVIESTSIGPRRHLVVARLGDELLVLGSSEGGIALLTTTPAPLAARRPAAAPAPAASIQEGRGFGLLARLRLAPQRTPAPVYDSLLSESVEDLELRRKLAAGQSGSVR